MNRGPKSCYPPIQLRAIAQYRDASTLHEISNAINGLRNIFCNSLEVKRNRKSRLGLPISVRYASELQHSFRTGQPLPRFRVPANRRCQILVVGQETKLGRRNVNWKDEDWDNYVQPQLQRIADGYGFGGEEYRCLWQRQDSNGDWVFFPSSPHSIFPDGWTRWKLNCKIDMHLRRVHKDCDRKFKHHEKFNIPILMFVIAHRYLQLLQRSQFRNGDGKRIALNSVYAQDEDLPRYRQDWKDGPVPYEALDDGGAPIWPTILCGLSSAFSHLRHNEEMTTGYDSLRPNDGFADMELEKCNCNNWKFAYNQGTWPRVFGQLSNLRIGPSENLSAEDRELDERIGVSKIWPETPNGIIKLSPLAKITDEAGESEDDDFELADEDDMDDVVGNSMAMFNTGDLGDQEEEDDQDSEDDLDNDSDNQDGPGGSGDGKSGDTITRYRGLRNIRGTCSNVPPEYLGG